MESAGSRESTADASDADGFGKGVAHVLCHSGIDADSGYVGYAGEMLAKFVDMLGHSFYFFDGIIAGKGCQVNLVEALHPYVTVIVLVEMLADDASSFVLYLFVVERKGILRKEFLKLIHDVG